MCYALYITTCGASLLFPLRVFQGIRWGDSIYIPGQFSPGNGDLEIVRGTTN